MYRAALHAKGTGPELEELESKCKTIYMSVTMVANMDGLFVGQKLMCFKEFDEFFRQYIKQTQHIFCAVYARTVE